MDPEIHAQRSKRIQEMQRRKLSQATETKGLLIVNTGPGKGKTSAAMGMGLRIAGHGKRLAVVQFIKSRASAERAVLGALPGVEWQVIGDGFTWDTQDLEADKATARRGWDQARKHLADPEVAMVILDELCIVLAKDYLPLEDVLGDLRDRPPFQHVVVTGRGVPEGLVEAADMVNEMRAVKHPFQAGIAAQAGIEY
ncbi:MAG: cob(I)yrinic acid a,c-diamide adenosyltransferase [Fibrobacterota bacterium]|nr:MAG: cob(I)yrinic acid a,c-diamide adenosyltransferase [Fibrobacterota bacterium]